MEQVHIFPDCLVVHIPAHLTFLLQGPKALIDLMETGGCFDDEMIDEGYKTLPTAPGVYRCTVEYWFEQGYSDGSPSGGESEWEFRLSDVHQLSLPMAVKATP